MKNLYSLKAPRLKAVELGDDGGIFKWRHNGKNFTIVASFGGGWDHVSVDASGLIPSWEDMAAIKDMFFEPEETVIEYHPAKSQYVNLAQDTLHLWRPQDEQIPVPPIWMV